MFIILQQVCGNLPAARGRERRRDCQQRCRHLCQHQSQTQVVCLQVRLAFTGGQILLPDYPDGIKTASSQLYTRHVWGCNLLLVREPREVWGPRWCSGKLGSVEGGIRRCSYCRMSTRKLKVSQNELEKIQGVVEWTQETPRCRRMSMRNFKVW